MSEHALQLIADNKKNPNKSLDLGRCGLREIPKEVLELTWLEELNFCNSWYERVDGRYQEFPSINKGEPNFIESTLDLGALLNLKKLTFGGESEQKWPVQELDFVKNVHYLYMCSCYVSDISALKEIKSLTSLYFSENQVSDISALKEIKSLRSLDFSRNQVSDISALKEIKSLTSLNFWDNQVSDISELKEIKSLTSLDFSHNQASDISALKEIKSLTSLNFSSNQVSDISALKDLKSLTSLYFYSNQVSDISALKEIKSLTSLNFSYNQVSDISALKEIKSLTSLHFSSNQVSDISALKELKSLTSLDFSENQVSDISALKEIKSLTSLDFSKNQISHISALKEIKSLTSLHFRNNQVSDISALKEIKSLTSLNFSSNQVSDISALKELKSLTSLYFYSNQVSDISALKELKSLTLLNFWNNQVSDISALKEIKSLTSLDFSKNQVSDLSNIFDWLEERLTANMTFSFRNNPLQIPSVEVLSEGRDRILRFIAEYKASLKDQIEVYNNRELKLIVLGNSHTGKSFLAEYLSSGYTRLPENDRSTHGIIHNSYDHTTLGGNEIRINLLDFGGQEYYHDTHQFFFTYETLYLLLWNKQSNLYGYQTALRYQEKTNDHQEETHYCYALPYWLDSIDQLRTLHADQDTIAIHHEAPDDEVQKQTASDNRKSALLNSKSVLLLETYRQKSHQELPDGNQIKEYARLIHSYNSIELRKESNEIIRRGIQGLRENLDEAIENMVIGKWAGYMKFFVQVFRDLNDSKIVNPLKLPTLEKLFINILEARDLCNQIIEAQNKNYKHRYNELGAKEVMQFLANRGYILYFNDQLICLKPLVLTQNIYDLLDRELIHESVVSKKTLQDKAGQKEIVQIMQDQKLIILHPDDKHYILPQHLPEAPTDEVKLFLDTFQESILEYDLVGYIQRYVIHEILYAFRKEIMTGQTKPYIWRNGLVIRTGSNKTVLARIEFCQNESKRTIAVSVNRDHPDFTVLRQVMTKLDDVLKNRKYTRYVRTPNQPLIPYDVLQEKALKRIHHYELPGNKIIRIADYKDWLERDLKNAVMKKVFISYSSKDMLFKERLCTHLEVLKSEGTIDYWHDGKIKPGSKWDDNIKQQMEESDLFICLLSPDFLATRYVREIEIPKIKEMISRADIKLLPILIHPCSWEKYFSERQMVFDDKVKTGKSILHIDIPQNDASWMQYIKKLEGLCGVQD
jgi:internalin A